MECAVAIAALGLLFAGCSVPAGEGALQHDVGRSIHPRASSGCSASGDKIDGAVEHAVGIVFGIVLLLGLRRARQSRVADQRVSERGDGRLPYRDLGMRESFASISDDR